MKIKSLLITITLCSSFLVNSILFGWEATRRPAEDFPKMSAETARQEENCIQAGGLPNYHGSSFTYCGKK